MRKLAFSKCNKGQINGNLLVENCINAGGVAPPPVTAPSCKKAFSDQTIHQYVTPRLISEDGDETALILAVKTHLCAIMFGSGLTNEHLCTVVPRRSMH